MRKNIMKKVNTKSIERIADIELRAEKRKQEKARMKEIDKMIYDNIEYRGTTPKIINKVYSRGEIDNICKGISESGVVLRRKPMNFYCTDIPEPNFFNGTDIILVEDYEGYTTHISVDELVRYKVINESVLL